MYLIIIFLPLMASVLANNRYCGSIGGPILSVICLKFAALCSVGIFYEVAISGAPVSIDINNWIDFGNILVEWNLYYDTLTAS